MADTAAGLFEDASVAEAVVDSLRAHGLPSTGIRVVTATTGNGNGSDDFTSLFAKDQRTMGIPEHDSDVYLTGLHRGNVLVYAMGTLEQAAEAAVIMNQFAAIEIGALGGYEAGEVNGNRVAPLTETLTGTGELGKINPESRLPESQVTIGLHEHSYTSHSSRSKQEGARLFSW